MLGEKAQVSFEYLLIAVFSIMIAVAAATMLETLRQIALSAQADILSERAKVIENVLQ